jgi:putative aldouronate transport system substrate-binding protein
MICKIISKRLVLAAFTLLVIAGMAFGSGGNQPGNSAVSGGKETLVIGIQSNSFVTDYKDNYLTQRMEKKHNLNLDFYLLPAEASEFSTKVSLMVASNDLPDIIYGRLTQDQILDYGSKGAFIPLNKYINDPSKSPNFNAIRDSDKNSMLTTIFHGW